MKCPPDTQEVTVIRAGETLVNPVSGETITFIETAAETNGEYTLIEVSVAPGGGVPMAHVHPYQTETFEVLEGELSMKAGRAKVVARAGEIVSVPPREVHKFWNATDSVVRFRCTVAPALGFERFIETMFALAADGKLLEPADRGSGEGGDRRLRERALRRLARPLHPGVDAKGRPSRRRGTRPDARLRPDVRAAGPGARARPGHRISALPRRQPRRQ